VYVYNSTNSRHLTYNTYTALEHRSAVSYRRDIDTDYKVAAVF